MTDLKERAVRKTLELVMAGAREELRRMTQSNFVSDDLDVLAAAIRQAESAVEEIDTF